MSRRFKIEKQFDYNGYECVVIGTQQGHRCGYVKIDNPTQEMKEHPYELGLNVHGGITYGSYGQDYPIKKRKRTFWLGFDCAHYRDGKDWDLIKELNDYEKYTKLKEIEDKYSLISPEEMTRS